MALRAYVFESNGLVNGAVSVILDHSYEEALAKAKTVAPYRDEPECRNPKGVPLTQAGVLYHDNGDM